MSEEADTPADDEWADHGPGAEEDTSDDAGTDHGHEDDHSEGDDHGHGEDRPDFDPHKVDLPSREPPLRQTAPQSDFASTQVVRGGVVLAVGLALTFGLAFLLA